MALTPVRIPALQAGRAIVDSRGAPATDFQRWINDGFKQLQNAQNATNAALVAAGLATAAAAAANAAAAGLTSEQSLTNSGPVNYAAPLLSADSLGNVTIANHDRQYGDQTLNPTVSVIGDVLATGAVPGDVVRPYYVDPTRAGGAVSYLFTINDDTAPVQSGDTHALGAVEIPAVGTQDGNPVRQPGQVAPTP